MSMHLPDNFHEDKRLSARKIKGESLDNPNVPRIPSALKKTLNVDKHLTLNLHGFVIKPS